MINTAKHKGLFEEKVLSDYFSYFLDTLRITEDDLWETDGCPGWYWLDLCTDMQREIENAAFIARNNSAI